MVQLAQIDTMGGTFKSNAYAVTQSDDVREGGEQLFGCKMDLEFSAADAVDCDRIGLTQTTTPTVKKLEAARETYGAARARNRAVPEHIEGEDVEGARYVDRQVGEMNPLFGAINPAEEEEPSLAPKSFYKEPENSLGSHTLDRFGTATNVPARLLDEPARDWSSGWSLRQSFETTALCVAGEMKGTYLGSIEWGYEVKPKDGEPNYDAKVLDMKLVRDAVPTPAFMASVEKWNQDRVPVDGGGERDTIPLPGVGTLDGDLAVPTTIDATLASLATICGSMHEEENPKLKEAWRNRLLWLHTHALGVIGGLERDALVPALAAVLAKEGIPDFERQYLQKLVWQRVRTLLTSSSKTFANNWLHLYGTLEEHGIGGQKDAFESLRDDFAAANGWDVTRWGVDSALQERCKGSVTARKLGDKYLIDSSNWPVICCLNPSDLRDETTVIGSGTEFWMPANLVVEDLR